MHIGSAFALLFSISAACSGVGLSIHRANTSDDPQQRHRAAAAASASPVVGSP